MKKILVVDDEKPISDIIKFNMAKEGYEVLTAFDGKEALAVFEAENPDILILDLMLPEIDGLEVARTIRKTSNVPIIVLSAKDTEFDKVIGLEIGADDYVTKPFDPNVLLAKIQGLLRRSYEFGTDQDLLEHRGAILNLKSMDLVYEGEVVNLTKNEFQILRILFEKAGSVVARDDLMKELWNSDFFIDDNTLSVNVARLRKKLEEAGLEHFIETKKGIGYGLSNG